MQVSGPTQHVSGTTKFEIGPTPHASGPTQDDGDEHDDNDGSDVTSVSNVGCNWRKHRVLFACPCMVCALAALVAAFLRVA
jgi:hypothetical protein